MLASGKFPEQLKGMGAEELESLCVELRQEIISVCLKNGGHLGASLGAVEIAVALHRIFDSPTDRIIWDVGHQAYAHKLLTGRASKFSTLRMAGGISGFLSRDESPHDIFGAGHSSTAISAALGCAYDNKNWTVAVVGDGGLTAGVTLEALNNIHSPNPRGPLLVILNDNQMSISENVGGIQHILGTGQGETFFQLFGLEYIGPLNGHDLPTLLATLNGIYTARPDRPVLLHLSTQKGKGYSPAEARPALFHGVGPAQSSVGSGKTPGVGEIISKSSDQSWSDLFCEALIRAAERDPKIVVITAAMSEGTGLIPFANKYPERFFDVGIAESHAATFAAGLASAGWKPVCAIYSTFLQRSFDAIIHDIALQKLPVIFAVDRAGFVGADGPTHHGVFDLAYAGLVPGTEIYVPEVASDLEGSLLSALKAGKASFIRYPRGRAVSQDDLPYSDLRVVNGATSVEKVLISFGPIGLRVAKILTALPEAQRKKLTHFSVIRAKPSPAEIQRYLENQGSALRELIFFEDGVRRGSLSLDLASHFDGLATKYFTYPDDFVGHGSVTDLERSIGWTDEVFSAAISEGL